MRWGLQQQFACRVLGCFLTISGLTAFWIVRQAGASAREDARAVARRAGRRRSPGWRISGRPGAPLRALSQALEGMDHAHSPENPAEGPWKMVRQVLEITPGALSAWVVYEPDAFDGKDRQHVGMNGFGEKGRFRAPSSAGTDRSAAPSTAQRPCWGTLRRGPGTRDPLPREPGDGAGTLFLRLRRRQEEPGHHRGGAHPRPGSPRGGGGHGPGPGGPAPVPDEPAGPGGRSGEPLLPRGLFVSDPDASLPGALPVGGGEREDREPGGPFWRTWGREELLPPGPVPSFRRGSPEDPRARVPRTGAGPLEPGGDPSLELRGPHRPGPGPGHPADLPGGGPP